MVRPGIVQKSGIETNDHGEFMWFYGAILGIYVLHLYLMGIKPLIAWVCLRWLLFQAQPVAVVIKQISLTRKLLVYWRVHFQFWWHHDSSKRETSSGHSTPSAPRQSKIPICVARAGAWKDAMSLRPLWCKDLHQAGPGFGSPQRKNVFLRVKFNWIQLLETYLRNTSIIGTQALNSSFGIGHRRSKAVSQAVQLLAVGWLKLYWMVIEYGPWTLVH